MKTYGKGLRMRGVTGKVATMSKVGNECTSIACIVTVVPMDDTILQDCLLQTLSFLLTGLVMAAEQWQVTKASCRIERRPMEGQLFYAGFAVSQGLEWHYMLRATEVLVTRSMSKFTMQ
jgi:hypothetical protein